MTPEQRKTRCLIIRSYENADRPKRKAGHRGLLPGNLGNLEVTKKKEVQETLLHLFFHSFCIFSSSVRPISKCVPFASPCAMAGKKFPVSAVR